MDLIIEDIQSQASTAKTKMQRYFEPNSVGSQFNQNQQEELNKIVLFQKSVQQMIT